MGYEPVTYCSVCGDSFDVYRAPDERICETCEETMERAELGVDGNAGFALLGPDLQEGEAEFVVIKTDAPVGTSEWYHEARSAAKAAYAILKHRLKDREFSYYLGPSYPDSC